MRDLYATQGNPLSDPEISALDRILPQVVNAFGDDARRRIVAGLSLDGDRDTPGYGFLLRRMMSFTRSPGGDAAEAGLRRTLKERVVTYEDVERLMALVGRSAGPDEVEEAVDRLHGDLPPGTQAPGAGSEILALCIDNLERASDVPEEAPPPRLFEGDFDGVADLDLSFPESPHEDPPPPMERARSPGRPAGRIADHWGSALRDALEAGGIGFSGLAGSMQVAAVTGYRGDVKLIGEACGATAAGTTQQPVLTLVLVDEDALLKSKATNTVPKVEALVRALLEDGNGIVYVTAQRQLPAFVEAHAVGRVDLSDCGGILMDVLGRLEEEGHSLTRERGGPLSEFVRGRVRSVPSSRTAAVRAWLRQAFDAGSVGAGQEDVLLRLAGRPLAAPVPVRPGPQSLEAVRGLAPETAARLLRIGRRLGSPEGARTGLLLSGPPGTGKTMLAALLAKASGRHFVNGSLAEWQSTGYLNDFLAAMRAAFDEARRNAPSILFIDEADSIGHRSSTGNRNDDYWNMVVNSMLECLQGLGDRGDVAVVMASNHPDLIDPAIRREGRVGETIEIRLPDRPGRTAILEGLLPEARDMGVDLVALADRTGTCSPAALEGLVAEARMLAREEDAPLAAAHLDQAMREAARGKVADGALPALAAGLAGEALMLSAAYGDGVSILGLSAEPGLADAGRVTADFASGRRPMDTAGDLLRALHVALAPAAARSLVEASGTRPGSGVLDCLTHLAQHEADGARSLALALVGSGAVTGGFPPEASVRERYAERVLGQAWDQVRKALRARRGEIDAIAGALMRDRRIDDSGWRAMAGGDEAPTLH